MHMHFCPPARSGVATRHRANDREGNHPACTSPAFGRGRLGTPGQAAKLYPCAARGAATLSALFFCERNPARDFRWVRQEIVFEDDSTSNGQGKEIRIRWSPGLTDQRMDSLRASLARRHRWERDTHPRAPNSRVPLPFYCQAICPISKLCRMLLSWSFQCKFFFTLRIAWQFSWL